MMQESWSLDQGKVPIQDFFVAIHKTRGSEWSNRAYKRVSRESRCNLILSGVALHKIDLGWLTLGCVGWGIVGEVTPPVPLGPG